MDEADTKVESKHESRAMRRIVRCGTVFRHRKAHFWVMLHTSRHAALIARAKEH